MELAGVCEEDMPGLHIYTKAAQLGRKQIFGDHDAVLSLVAFRHHAFCPLEIVKVCTIRGLKLLIIVDKSSHSFYLYCCTVWLQKMTLCYVHCGPHMFAILLFTGYI